MVYMSTLEVATDNLSPVLYKEIIEVISQNLKKAQGLLWAKASPTSATLRFDIDKLAVTVAKEFAFSNKYPFENRDGTTYASIHMPTGAEKEAFSGQIQRLIVRELQSLIQAQVGPESIEQFVTGLLKPIGTFSADNIIGLHYPLEKPYPFEKRKLHLEPTRTTDDPWLKGHKLTLHVGDINTFIAQVMQGICNYIEQQGCEKGDLEDTRDALEAMAHNPKSPLKRLQDHVTKQSLARIQREAKVWYLAYLHKSMQTWKAQDKEEGMKLLGTLVRRLRRVDTYISQAKEDAHFQVSYQSASCNYRTLFSREDAFDMLPIIPEIEGFLGETTDQVQGAKTFVSGLKLKLNGPVQIHGGGGRSVYQYYLALLDPKSKEYLAREAEANSLLRFQEKVLKVALLYYFVFMNMDDPAFDPVASFEQEILEVLRTGTEEAKVTALQVLQRKIVSCEKEIFLLRRTLENFLDHRSIGPARLPKTLVLSLKKSLLVNDIDSMVTHSIFFQEDFENNGGRDVLKYVAVEDASASSEALCKLPLQIIFEPMYYYAIDNTPERFTMTYETTGLQALPIFLAPLVGDPMKYKVIEQTNRIMLYYRHHPEMLPDSAQAFAYRFTFLLLAYVFIKVLVDSISTVEKRKLFFPILCLHAKEKAPDQQDQKLDEETFMHALSKLLSHMLAEDYLSNSQGFYKDTMQGHGLNVHKLNSALYSLYTGLPRRFELKQSLPLTPIEAPQTTHHALEKLAVIVVSSRKCDVNQKTPEQYQSTVFGEFIGIERLESEYIRVSTLSTFSINQEAKQMYRRPEAIIEQVKVWYALGYRHFLYIAQAPYSSTLHISDKSGNEELFFMNRDIIQAIRDVERGIKVYPVFCDKYYVINHKRKERKPQKVDSLYVDDIGELSNLVNDPSKRSLVFFNLFNGASVKTQVYNGVMSYATLMNVYENDPTYDQYIWSDILGRSIPGSLKTELLDFLTLLHFARYEKPRDFGFKLDPYKRIIGDTSIGKISIFPNMKGSVRFNALAFLTLVRAVLHAHR